MYIFDTPFKENKFSSHEIFMPDIWASKSLVPTAYSCFPLLMGSYLLFGKIPSNNFLKSGDSEHGNTVYMFVKSRL
jgi:hypothetical protein